MNKRYFQWLSGDNIGKVVEFNRVEEDEDMMFFVFINSDGMEERCNVDFIADIKEKNPIGKYMVEVSDPNNIWHFQETYVGGQEERWEKNEKGQLVCVAPAIPGKRKVVPIPPKPSLDRFGIEYKPTTAATATTNNTAIENDNSIMTTGYVDARTDEERQRDNELYKTATITTSDSTIGVNSYIEYNDIKNENKFDYSNDPVVILAKNAKKHNANIDMQIEISLPSKSLYTMIKNDFENGTETFFDYIISSIDVNSIKDAIRESLKNAYENSEQ